eukprot:3937718-Amphidinium_carterae.2
MPICRVVRARQTCGDAQFGIELLPVHGNGTDIAMWPRVLMGFLGREVLQPGCLEQVVEFLQKVARAALLCQGYERVSIGTTACDDMCTRIGSVTLAVCKS